MSQNHTETLVIKVKGVCDSNPNPSFGRDCHVQQVAPGRHPASARKIKTDKTSKIATRDVRTLHQKGKLEIVVKEMERMKLKILGLAEIRWTGAERRIVQELEVTNKFLKRQSVRKSSTDFIMPNYRSDLKRNYGFFRCSSCKKQWESSHVYGKFVNRKYVVQYGQECKECKVMCMPYHTEPIKCRVCGQESCHCRDEMDDDHRHVDDSKPHRSDLCGKCRAGLPCHQRRF
ncbi:zygote arrest protein 1-like [Plakobranchus ocellatus]|uniref:Zygote arrest protein 1-like n=1 Tax=Plakobranchus ocellatus TaxID=259542 RepID=A0AAV4BSC2_9GAST|nr:zygote arrest protein 1-like [Plakobranchus ocellatus]